MSNNIIELSLFSNQIQSICEEMGLLLQRSAFSTNIRDRLDFSCAFFDNTGKLCAQAAHIPVHLGSMAYAMKDIIKDRQFSENKMLIINDPYSGGTHLPDVTVIAPLFYRQQLLGFVCNRAHHADIGANAPGSMPLSSHLDEEGVVIKATEVNALDLETDQHYQRILQKLRNASLSNGDFSAQVGANLAAIKRLQDWLQEHSITQFTSNLEKLNAYGRTLAQKSLQNIPPGKYCFYDFLDDDGQDEQNIKIQLILIRKQNKIIADFSGSHKQVKGNINCPFSVTAAAVYYVFRCLMPDYTPACQGIFDDIEIIIPKGCFLNAQYPAAVAAGNVETSTRVVDVVLGALAQAIPDQIPAASHGSMNNLAMGSTRKPYWDYYETIGGGSGAHSRSQGFDARQTHLTNTLNTPIEVLEMNYPLRVWRYAIRKSSGGAGLHSGGNGIDKEVEFLQDAQVSLLTERRKLAPWGLNGAKDAQKARNLLNQTPLAGKASFKVKKGDCLTIQTAGGGGWGKARTEAI